MAYQTAQKELPCAEISCAEEHTQCDHTGQCFTAVIRVAAAKATVEQQCHFFFSFIKAKFLILPTFNRMNPYNSLGR